MRAVAARETRRKGRVATTATDPVQGFGRTHSLRVPKPLRRGLFSPSTSARSRLRQRTWVPAMVPWRATEDGFVTEDVLDWYERFAEGEPGAIVVEATGIRDVPSGPLLRIGHDRFLPGLAGWSKRCAARAAADTRLFIQLIDFLAIRRRPDPQKFFERFLAITDRASRARSAMPGAGRCGGPRRGSRALERRPNSRTCSRRDELEALQFGYRERVTDIAARAHPRSAAGAARPVRRRRRARRAGRLRRRRAALRARLHDGVVSLAHQHPRGRLRRLAREPRPAAARGLCRGPRAASARSFAVGCRFLADECIDGGSDVDDARSFGVAFARAGMDFLSTVARRQIRRRQAAGGRRGGLSLYRAERLRVHAAVHLRRTRPVRPQRRADGGDPRRRSATPACRCRWCAPAASTISKWRRIISPRGVCDIVGAARQSARRSGLVPQDPRWGVGGERAAYANTPTTAKGWIRSTSRSPASFGTSCLPPEQKDARADGKRRLTAPAWQPPT